MGDDACVLVFVKRPDPGKVKTRLAEGLGAEAAAELYRCFVEDTLSVVDGLNVPVIMCFHPPDARAPLAAWLGADRTYHPQQGDDLGERMANAFTGAFAQGYRRAVLIGTDSPDLEPLLVHEALNVLEDHDAVVGPAQDGGYYLIGFSKEGLTPAVFHNVPWSTPEVLEHTLDVLFEARAALHLLPPWGDVDTPADLRRLWERCKYMNFGPSRTMRYREEHPDLLG